MMGFEPTTSTLARLRSTTELHPRVSFPYLTVAGSAWKRGYYTHLRLRRKPFFVENEIYVEKWVLQLCRGMGL